MRMLFLPGTWLGPSARFRIHQFVPYLRDLGHEVDIHVINPERTSPLPRTRPILRQVTARSTTARRIASLAPVFLRAPRYDVIMMNRDLIPEHRVRFLEPLLAQRNNRLIFDFDDAIHLSREIKLQTILPHFAVVTPGNEYLAAYAREIHSDVRTWPTVVDTNLHVPRHDASNTSSAIRIGWSGSPSTAKVDLPSVKQALVKLKTKIDFEFVLISSEEPSENWEGINTRFIRWSPETEVAGLQQMDIGIMPLEDGPFQRGKCSLKAILYMANGIPAVVSPVGANVTTVVDGVTGFHASSVDEWVESLTRLAIDSALRKEMGQAGREHVVANYSIKSLLPKMLDTFEYVSSL